MEAANILPAEMWMEIIGNLEDPKDWYSCYNTCSLFRDFMKEDKVPALLPAVLDILEERQFSSPTFPTDLKLESEYIQNLRLVSKSWKHSVDRHIANHPATQTLVMFPDPDLEYENLFMDHFEAALPVSIDLKSRKDSKKITEILESWNKSNTKEDPIIPSRHLVVENLPFKKPIRIIDEDQEMKANLEGTDEAKANDPPLLQLLRKIGKTIWHFGVNGLDQEFHQPARMEAWFNVIRQCLLLLPNLKSLYITQPNFGSGDPNFDWIFRYNTNFPHLPHLEVLQCNSLDYKFINCLLLPNQHIKKLNIKCGVGAEEVCKIINSVNLKNLTDFSVCELVHHGWVEYIKLLESFNLPLTKLSFTNRVYFIEKPIPAERLFEAVKPFGTTLTHLSFGIIEPPESGVIRVTANLTKLRHLELAMEGRSGNKIRVEFVYPFDNQIDCKIILKNKLGSNLLAES